MKKTTKQDQRQTFDRETWIKCNSCQGRGLIQPMIHTNPEYTCDGCNGIGWIPPDGEPLNEHEAIRMMRQVIKRQSRRINILKSQVNPSERSQADPHAGAGTHQGGRFVGD